MTTATITMTTITIPSTRVFPDMRFVPEPLVAERPPGEPRWARPRPTVAVGLTPMPELALLRPWSRL